MIGRLLDETREFGACGHEIVLRDGVFDVDFDAREVVSDLLLLGHARDFLLDGLRARPCFRVVELLDQENQRGGNGHGDSAGGEQAQTFTPRPMPETVVALLTQARV